MFIMSEFDLFDGSFFILYHLFFFHLRRVCSMHHHACNMSSMQVHVSLRVHFKGKTLSIKVEKKRVLSKSISIDGSYCRWKMALELLPSSYTFTYSSIKGINKLLSK